jgi:hypothetical protein
MVRAGHTILAAAFAAALISSPVVAQNGSVSLVHTVTVTVPPRVQVQVGAFSAATTSVKVGNLNSSTQGLSVSVKASQAWTLSISAAPDRALSSIRWSRDASSGYVGLTPSDVTIASGVLSNQSHTSDVFFREINSSSNGDSSATPVVLTVAAQ